MAGMLGALGGTGAAAGGAGTGAAAGAAASGMMGGSKAGVPTSPTQVQPTFQQSQPAPQVGPLANPMSPAETVSNSMYPPDIQQATANPVAKGPSTMDLINQYINSPGHQRLMQQNQDQMNRRNAAIGGVY